jgi:alpha-galactosidase
MLKTANHSEQIGKPIPRSNTQARSGTLMVAHWVLKGTNQRAMACSSSTRLASLALVSLLAMHIVCVAGQCVSSDNFDGTSLKPFWTVSSQNPDSQVNVTAGRLFLVASPLNGGSDLPPGSNQSAPCAVQSLDTNSSWSVSVYLQFEPSADYQGAGIALFDSTNGVSRLAERAFISGTGSVVRSVGSFVPCSQAALFLRVDKVGQRYSGYYSFDGQNWVQNGQTNIDTPFTSIGLFSIRQPRDGNLGVYSSAAFDNFRFEELRLNISQLLTQANYSGVPQPMGYNTWYDNGPQIGEAMLLSTAAQMATNGLRAAGYQYICIDDGWQGFRDNAGNIVADTNKFPHGIAALATQLHQLGFKVGIYTEPGQTTSAGFIGSFGHLEQDANTFAAWGVDYVKFDTGGADVPQPNETEQFANAAQIASATTERPMYLNSGIGKGTVWEPWMGWTLNSWRRTGDWEGAADPQGFGHFQSLLTHVDLGSNLPWAVCPGHASDLDILLVDAWIVPSNSIALFKAKVGMWSLLGSPLLVDRVDAVPGTLVWTNLQLACNPEVISIDQDPAGLQATVAASSNVVFKSASAGWQVWCKPLSCCCGPAKAIGVLNRSTNQTYTVTINWTDIGLEQNAVALVHDVWTRTDIGYFTNSCTASVEPLGLSLFTIKAQSQPSLSGVQALLSWPAWTTNYNCALQWRSNFSGDWQTIPGSPAKSGGRFWITNSSVGAGFYRLRLDQ